MDFQGVVKSSQLLRTSAWCDAARFDERLYQNKPGAGPDVTFGLPFLARYQEYLISFNLLNALIRNIPERCRAPSFPFGQGLFIAIQGFPVEIVNAWIATVLAACPRLRFQRL